MGMFDDVYNYLQQPYRDRQAREAFKATLDPVSFSDLSTFKAPEERLQPSDPRMFVSSFPPAYDGPGVKVGTTMYGPPIKPGVKTGTAQFGPPTRPVGPPQQEFDANGYELGVVSSRDLPIQPTPDELRRGIAAANRFGSMFTGMIKPGGGKPPEPDYEEVYVPGQGRVTIPKARSADPAVPASPVTAGPVKPRGVTLGAHPMSPVEHAMNFGLSPSEAYDSVNQASSVAARLRADMARRAGATTAVEKLLAGGFSPSGAYDQANNNATAAAIARAQAARSNGATTAVERLQSTGLSPSAAYDAANAAAAARARAAAGLPASSSSSSGGGYSSWSDAVRNGDSWG